MNLDVISDSGDCDIQRTDLGFLKIRHGQNHSATVYLDGIDDVLFGVGDCDQVHPRATLHMDACRHVRQRREATPTTCREQSKRRIERRPLPRGQQQRCTVAHRRLGPDIEQGLGEITRRNGDVSEDVS